MTKEEKEKNTRLIAKYVVLDFLQKCDISQDILIQEFSKLIATRYAESELQKEFNEIISLMTNIYLHIVNNKNSDSDEDSDDEEECSECDDKELIAEKVRFINSINELIKTMADLKKSMED